jgi:uroporphyrinogen decarboxylase
MGDDLVVQGNLDPVLALAGAEPALAGTDAVLADNVLADGSRHPGHIFNLGHGVHPPTDPDVLAAVVARVHERTAR